MCHDFEPHDWSSDAQEESEEPEESPSFVNDEAAAESELLTDGGDEDEE